MIRHHKLGIVRLNAKYTPTCAVRESTSNESVDLSCKAVAS